MSTLNLDKIAKAIKNERILAELENLKKAETNRINTVKKLKHRFDAVVNATIPVWNVEMIGMDLISNAEKLTWENAYMLEDECFNEMLERKHKVVLENGYDLEFGYCPILIAESGVREVHHKLVELFTELVDSSFDNLYLNMVNLNKFKALMISVAFSHKSWR